jgi:predicted nucleic acid-binding protein
MRFVRLLTGRRSINCGRTSKAARRRPSRWRQRTRSGPSATIVDRRRRIGLDRTALANPAAKSVLTHLFAAGETLHAPHLLDIEVAQVIRRSAARCKIDGDRGRMALADLSDLRMQRYQHDFLLPRVWELRNNATAYDAVYLALAEALDAVLVKRDHRLAGAAGHHARVVLV